MSRIHEALKKAEQDRAVAQAPDISALQQISLAETAPAHAASDSQSSAGVNAATTDELAVAAAVDSTPGNPATFEDLRANCAHPRWLFNPKETVFQNAELNSRAAEQFRTLRSRLYHIRADQPLRTIIVTSAIPQEGKTWVTINLAQAIVRQVDRSALIIDADLRASRLHVPLGATSTPGLTDYLRGEADEKAIIQHGAEGNLYFIASGTQVPNPSELLSNGRMKTLLERVSGAFDWVILDSPPWLSVADASILAGLCDGVLLVVRAGVTPSAMAEKAHQELEGRNVIGIVLNGVEDSKHYGSSYYRSYGNGTGAGESKDSVGPNGAGKPKVRIP